MLSFLFCRFSALLTEIIIPCCGDVVLHLAVIQWPTGTQANHYKYVHHPNISSNGMEIIHIKFLSGLAAVYPASAEMKELNFCH